MARSFTGWVTVLVEALRSGELVDLAPDAGDDDLDLTRAADWPDHRRLPGGAIRAALLDPGLKRTPADPRGLRIRAACITGTVDLAHLRIAHPLQLVQCRLEEVANWQHLSVHSLDLTSSLLPGLQLNGADIAADACLTRLRATGEVHATGATIGGQLRLDDAVLTNPKGNALTLNRAVIRRGAHLTRMKAAGDIRVGGATIGWLSLDHAILTKSDDGEALSLDLTEVNGSAFLTGLQATGEVRAVGATIGGQLNLEQADLRNPGGDALSIDRADITHNATLTGLTAIGQVRAVGATIGGDLILEQANLHNRIRTALSIAGAEIKQNATLTGLKATGQVNAIGATVGGQLNLERIELTSFGRSTLTLQAAEIEELWLAGARVEGDASLNGASIRFLVSTQGFRATKLSLAGWRIGDLQVPSPDNGRDAVAELLTKASTKTKFAPQPWHEIANIFDRNGQSTDARWLRWAAARGVARVAPWWSKPWRWLYGLLVGHGYYPLLAGLWLAAALIMSVVLVSSNQPTFSPTTTNRATVITQPQQSAAPATGTTPCEQLSDPAVCFRPVLFALDNVLPGTLTTGQANLWTANRSPWLPYALGILKITSWILVALLLAGVTGLLRKT